jgi:hypothetical protein
MELEPDKRFWVKYTVGVDMPGGFDAESSRLKGFLAQLTAECAAYSPLAQSSVYSPGRGKLVFTTVVEAQGETFALAKALDAFATCVQLAGANSDLDGLQGHAYELIKASESQAEVKELKEFAETH